MTRVVFVSYQLKGLDGVSMETEKWASVLEEWGCEVHRCAGHIADPGPYDHVIPLLNHRDPAVQRLTEALLGSPQEESLADAALLQSEMSHLAADISAGLEGMADAVGPDLLVLENVLSLPLNLPLSLALASLLERWGLPAIAKHHDLYWQYPAYRKLSLPHLAAGCLPPQLPLLTHVTTSREAGRELYEKTGISATCIHNCFDFARPCRPDAFNARLRGELGIPADDVLFLQPTEAAAEKGVEAAVRFVRDFGRRTSTPARLVVTGGCRPNYRERFRQVCHAAGITAIHIPGWLGARRHQAGAVSRYSLHDLYATCDMVTFPSRREGFGSPVLESVAHRKPLLVANYPVLGELRGYGFQFLPLDRQAAGRAISLLRHPQLMAEMLERNFEIGQRHFSLEVLEDRLEELVAAALSPGADRRAWREPEKLGSGRGTGGLADDVGA